MAFSEWRFFFGRTCWEKDFGGFQPHSLPCSRTLIIAEEYKAMKKAWILLAAQLCVAIPFAAELAVPNPSFEKGKTHPDAWEPSTPSCSWETDGGASGPRCIAVTGNGQTSNYWRSRRLPFQGGQLYRVSFQARGQGASGGTAITGPVFCNWDAGCPGDEWRDYSTVFACPDKLAAADSWLRFGQWHVNGRLEFDDIRLATVQAVYDRLDALVLGEGEHIAVAAGPVEQHVGDVAHIRHTEGPAALALVGGHVHAALVEHVRGDPAEARARLGEDVPHHPLGLGVGDLARLLDGQRREGVVAHELVHAQQLLLHAVVALQGALALAH